jgi:transmembrane sensor
MNSPSDAERPDTAPTPIEAAAIAWLTEREDGFAAAREREFSRWLQADPRHAAAVAHLEQTLDRLHELPQFRAEINEAFGRTAPILPFPAAPAPPAVPVRRRRARLVAWTGLAAALALGLVADWRSFQAPTDLRYATTVSGYERARLADGSTLELNAASAVRVHFTPAERRLELENGEAHFAVAHDTARPFVVSAGGVSVRAVGTAFNVRLTAGGAVEVIVTEGRVRIGQNGPESSAAPEAPVVAAGERLVLPRRAPVAVVEKIPPTDLRAALAWQSRLADFAEAPLAAVVERFNARSRVRIVLADAELGARPIGGTFALDESEAFVRLLERDGEIAAERHGDAEIRLRRAH